MATPMALRVMEAQARVYRRTWKGSAVSAFLNPVLYLLAMGVGLGSLVDRGVGRADLDLPYLVFLAPGLLAAVAMQTAAGEGSWPVMAGFKWRKTYQATLATPVSVADLVAGHLGWVTVRLLLTALVFSGVMVAFGTVTPGGAVLAIAPAVLTGLAFAAPITAFTATLDDTQGLSAMFRFGIVPMFLFSGTFFPISQLPDWVEPVAYVVPLWHGVELCRGLALGVGPALSPFLHVGYLALFVVAGWAAARLTLGRRLIQ